jgi:hypothetical protein
MNQLPSPDNCVPKRRAGVSRGLTKNLDGTEHKRKNHPSFRWSRFSAPASVNQSPSRTLTASPFAAPVLHDRGYGYISCCDRL